MAKKKKRSEKTVHAEISVPCVFESRGGLRFRQEALSFKRDGKMYHLTTGAGVGGDFVSLDLPDGGAVVVKLSDIARRLLDVADNARKAR